MGGGGEGGGKGVGEGVGWHNIKQYTSFFSPLTF